MIVIADEPTGNIDPVQSLEILKLLKQVHQDGATVIIASHDQNLVDAMQTRVIRLEDGKLVRDAAGGYDTSKATTEEGGMRKHRIFDRRPVHGSEPVEAAAEAESEPRARKSHDSHRGSDDGGARPGHVKPVAI